MNYTNEYFSEDTLDVDEIFYWDEVSLFDK